MKQLIVLALIGLSGLTSAAQLETMSGYARDLASGQLLYIERHQRWFEQDRIKQQRVRYELPDGTEFARKLLRYDGATEQPQFTFFDWRRGHQEALVRDAEELIVGGRKGYTKPWRERRLMASSSFVADAGFDQLIQSQWDQLSAGKQIRLPFLVPIARKTVPFVVRQINAADAEVTFRMQAKNWFVRMLVDPIDVTYDRASRRLLRYRGISNLRDERLKNFKVEIEFPADERRSEMVTEIEPLQLPSATELASATAERKPDGW